jgi:pyruvate kinase
MSKVKRTKIVATLGPVTSTPEMIEKLIDAGVNAFRLNFSHGTHESHGQLIKWIKEKREEKNLPVAIMQDLSGPKIRVGIISDPPLELRPGDELIFDTGLDFSSANMVPVTYPYFAEDVQEGHQLLLADGSIELKIVKVTSPKVYCTILVGGKLSSHKGINYPDGSFRLPAVTDKDREDLKFGLKQGVDYVALSFVKTAGDVEIAREICRSANKRVPLIAKIEKHEAVNNFLEILKKVDGVMVARGDLGVEIPLEKVPLIQKKIIHLANLQGKPVITATQMLLSMVNAPRPTRAEATDIANAILDGTDAIMLSDETASGNYPLQAVETMNRIALETERHFPFYEPLSGKEGSVELDIAKAISGSACSLAEKLEASAILCPTSSGFTARMISRFRPKAKVFALTTDRTTYYQLALLWGVMPNRVPVEYKMQELLDSALQKAITEGLLRSKNRYVITAGFPFGQGGPTNLIYAGELP